MQRALQIFGIVLFLFLGFCSTIESTHIRDGRWYPQGWLFAALIFFGLAYLMAMQRPQNHR